MALPLQPDLKPDPPAFRRAIIAGLIVCAILALGLLSQAHRRPPQLILSGPGHEYDYARTVERLITGARKKVWVMLFVAHPDGDGPATRLLEALAAAAARGLDVQVCLDQSKVYGTADLDLKHEEAAAWLRNHGVTVVIDEIDRTSHGKIVLIDERTLVIGSHNWTRPALTSNREASLVVDDPALVRQACELFATIPGWRTQR